MTANLKTALLAAVLLSAAAGFSIGHYAGYQKGRAVAAKPTRAGEAVQQPSTVAGDIQTIFFTNHLSRAGSTGVPNPDVLPALTALEATELAQRLANDQTEALYKCRPFYESNTPPALRFGSGWRWHARCAHGKVDFEVSVHFGRTGQNPDVKVTLLDSRAGAFFPSQREE